MAGDEDLPAVFGGDGVYARLVGGGEDAQRAHLLDVGALDGGVARVRHHEHVVKAAEENRALILHAMGEYAEHLLGQRLLLNAEMMIERRLRAPADVERAVDVRLAPVHDAA